MNQRALLRLARQNARVSEAQAADAAAAARQADLAGRATLQQQLEAEIRETLRSLERAGWPDVEVVRFVHPGKFSRRLAESEKPGWQIYSQQVRNSDPAESIGTERTFLLHDGRIVVAGTVLTPAEFFSNSIRRADIHFKLRQPVLHGIRQLRKRVEG